MRTPHSVEIFGELLGHAFGDGRDEYLVVVAYPLVDLLQQVIDLVVRDPHFEWRINQSCRPDQLFDDHSFALHQFVVGRCGAHVDRGADQLFELLEAERPVVFGCGKTEPVLHEVLLAGAVAAEHGVHLGERDVALVDHHQVILRKIVQQAEGSRPFCTSVEIAGVVLDAGTVTQLLDHLQVVLHPLLDPLRFGRTSRLLEEGDLLAQVEVDLLHGRVYALLGRDKQAHWVKGECVERLDPLAGYGVDALDALDFVVEKGDAETLVAEFAESRHDVDRVARHAECRGGQFPFGPGIERFDQFVEELLVVEDFADFDMNGHRVEIARIAAAVQTRYAGNDDDVPPPREQGGGRTQTHLFDFVVDRKVLFDIGIRRR